MDFYFPKKLEKRTNLNKRKLNIDILYVVIS
jgi:hypothetical protein